MSSYFLLNLLESLGLNYTAIPILLDIGSLYLVKQNQFYNNIVLFFALPKD